jgi:hypothetical protein
MGRCWEPDRGRVIMPVISTIRYLIRTGEYQSMSLQEMGRVCGVTRQRIQQIFVELGVTRRDMRKERYSRPHCWHCGKTTSKPRITHCRKHVHHTWRAR